MKTIESQIYRQNVYHNGTKQPYSQDIRNGNFINFQMLYKCEILFCFIFYLFSQTLISTKKKIFLIVSQNDHITLTNNFFNCI